LSKRSQRKSGRIALVLGGGGITGGVYEIGALMALNDYLENISINDFDMYVGVSAGSLVAAQVCSGHTPGVMMSALASRRGGAVPPFLRSDVYGLNLEEWGFRMTALPRILARGVLQTLTPGAEMSVSDMVYSLTEVVPSGVLDNSPLETYANRMLALRGMDGSFEGMPHDLYIPALNLDTGHLVVFGETGTTDVSVGRAVRASSSIPFVFRPTRIAGQDFVDGGFERNLPVDVAVKHGAELVFALNPLVPVLNVPDTPSWALFGKRAPYLGTRGGGAVLDQIYRTLVHTRMQYRLRATQERFPEVDYLLFEPDANDMVMFRYNVMRYSARLIIAEHAYRRTRSVLERNRQQYEEILGRHGIKIVDQMPDRPARMPAERAGLLDRVIDVMEEVPIIRRWASSDDSDPDTLLGL
jgi:predicted acylesterase/phospholipase RssA